MKHLALCSAVFLLLASFCKSKPALSPEETVQLWQSYIDKNQFGLARNLSAEEALLYVNELAGYNIGADTLEWENNVMLNLKCQVIGDSAVCTYNFEDELSESPPGQLALKRVKGRWLVSHTDFEDGIPYDTLRPGDKGLLFPADSLHEEGE